MDNFLDFERSVMDVASRIKELQTHAENNTQNLPEKDIGAEIERLEIKQARLLRVIYRNLTPFQKVQVARHPSRPHAQDYITNLITNFTPLAGDKLFAEDAAMIAGIGRFNGQSVAVLGTEKGNSTKNRMKHNFGMPKPEGYRKAQRIMKLAEQFSLPLISFVDTPGAFPGIEAEARGQSEAIAKCIEMSFSLNVPYITVVTGEGGSGGALAVAVADRVFLLEHSVYSVISPEGCASILWKQANKETIPQAAEALKMTSVDLEKLGVIDGVIKEPVGGAHRDINLTYQRVEETIESALEELATQPTENLKTLRREKFLSLTK